ncbi:MAG TPA: phosphoribosylaminoimidazolesuccinocarboxamide synthase [Moorella mulderi]|nr:phosphoribosylaminoimidazolesuccinocarboxamide synthase [Moorella mulderi]
MQKVYEGKTKEVYSLGKGLLLLRFKDTVTGEEGRIDPGANQVIGEIEGKGQASFRASLYFFHLLQENGFPTHFVASGEEEGYGPKSMIVKEARAHPLEVICRRKAWGSFVRRYGRYISEGAPLPYLVEFTLKDDERGDPFITEEVLKILGIASEEAIQEMKEMARRVAVFLEEHLSNKGLELLDLKLEFGEAEGKLVIIDEISGDCMRVRKGGRLLLPHELVLALEGKI